MNSVLLSTPMSDLTGILSAALSPAVSKYQLAIDIFGINEFSVGDPVVFQDTTAVIRGAAVAAIILLWIVKVSITVCDVLVASSSVEMMGESAVSIPITVVSIDSCHTVGVITHIIIISTFGILSSKYWIFHSLGEVLLESLCPNWSFWRSLLLKEISLD